MGWFENLSPSTQAKLERAAWALASFQAQHHWLRIVMDGETRALVDELQPEQLDALEISGETWIRKAQFKTYRATHYPDYDVCASPLDDQQFDLIIAEQVFEHLLWPYRAGRNVHAMLRPGGHFLVTTPFLVKIHGDWYGDCSRWTETGLKHFLAESGFDIEKIRTGSWGNRACVKANLNRWAWKWPWRSLRNEPDFPLAVWALAEK